MAGLRPALSSGTRGTDGGEKGMGSRLSRRLGGVLRADAGVAAPAEKDRVRPCAGVGAADDIDPLCAGSATR
jgi:hypothetical protein